MYFGAQWGIVRTHPFCVMVHGVVTLVLHVFWGRMGYFLHPPVLSVVVDGVVKLVLRVFGGTMNEVLSAPTLSHCHGTWRCRVSVTCVLGHNGVLSAPTLSQCNGT